ncbi:zf-CCHC_4 domain-containing protein [Cephalotus follicularis]|uniref:Zf-CCHC_4 domain-containing protein n=1 Tax=Cephalotus follicularis TaxID=3775 RepID=A0A1Q3DCQ1_CEPFO|nr:zf-CCHC_4 domain-containing protein [Cephalotus follicularis]
MSPRLCVEMDLAMMLPDEVVIAIGTEEIFHQKIEYDMRIGFCFHCHLQGHLESNCRKKQSQAIPRPADPSSSSPPGNASLLTPNGDVVSAALPAGTLRAHARDPKRKPSSVLPSPCTPPVCENAPSTNFPHNQAPAQAPSCPSLPLAIPSPGLTQSPSQSSPLAIPSDDNNP